MVPVAGDNSTAVELHEAAVHETGLFTVKLVDKAGLHGEASS